MSKVVGILRFKAFLYFSVADKVSTSGECKSCLYILSKATMIWPTLCFSMSHLPGCLKSE